MEKSQNKEMAISSVRPMINAGIDFDTATKTIASAFGICVEELREEITSQDAKILLQKNLLSEISAAYNNKDLDSLLKFAETETDILRSIIRENEGPYYHIAKTTRGLKIQLKRKFK